MKTIAIVCLYIFDFIVTGFTTCYIWNTVIATILGVSTITFWQAYALILAIYYFRPRKSKTDIDYIDFLTKDIIWTFIVTLLIWIINIFA